MSMRHVGEVVAVRTNPKRVVAEEKRTKAMGKLEVGQFERPAKADDSTGMLGRRYRQAVSSIDISQLPSDFTSLCHPRYRAPVISALSSSHRRSGESGFINRLQSQMSPKFKHRQFTNYHREGLVVAAVAGHETFQNTDFHGQHFYSLGEWPRCILSGSAWPN
ncbi:hypothetical protein EJ06DRAFT_272277 [Trichodelitschia bisporula]|uniref:Uncharacterized protein n=1 Tax=Trichodelitschia bisporula TaxID=703511 RepID=A0A6G1I550_9PEZI|nr:hypothetical protein EJ06DRAFT_272277 [Trichodelitschia bisporula]